MPVSPLHDLEVLTHLAEEDSPRVWGWASARLAIRAPERFQRLPVGGFGGIVSVMAHPPGLHQAFEEALRSPAAAEEAAQLALTLWRTGVPVEPLADALREAIRGDGAARDMWLGLALGPLGPLEPDHFAAAARASSERHAGWALPLLVLRQCGPEDLTETARAVARELTRNPRDVAQVLAYLGAATFEHEALTDPDEAVRLGRQVAGSSGLPGPSPKGGRKTRARRWIQQLLEGVDGPAAALVRALAHAGEPPTWLASTAAWLATPHPGRSAVERVLAHDAGHDHAALRLARQQITEEHVPALIRAMEALAPGAGCLAMPLRHGEHGPKLARAQIQALGGPGLPGTLTEVAAAILAWQDDAPVVEFLADRDLRPLGLALAEWVPSEAVLAALLELPLPADPAERRLFVGALAAMGDHAVVPYLTELARDDADGAYTEPIALAEGLLGVSLR